VAGGVVPPVVDEYARRAGRALIAAPHGPSVSDPHDAGNPLRRVRTPGRIAS
jgi:hypothetical protein